MSEMVERVARAICRQANIDDGYDDGLVFKNSMDAGMWKNHIDQARAAIEAMREPTREMGWAGLHTTDALDQERTGVVSDVWQAMIAAALKN